MSALLIDLTVRGSAAFFLVWGADFWLASRMQARWRRLWWLLVPVVFLMPWKAAVIPAPAPDSLVAPLFAAPSVVPDSAGESEGEEGTFWTPARWVGLVWMAGAIGCGGVLVIRTVRASRRWRGLRFSTDARLLGILEDGKMRAGVTAPIGLVVACEVEAPAIVGWLRPRILLPSRFASSASEERLRHVLLHELAHFRALDVPAGWLFAVARCVHWFNPAAHLAAARWATFREEAADENAIRWSRQSGPAAYGETLLSFVRAEPVPPVEGILAIGETFSHLKHRIAMITRHAQRHPKPLLAALLAVVVTALATLQAQTPGESSPAPADSSGAKAAAVAAMEKWLAGIDAGGYPASWDAAAGSFQQALPSASWVAALNAVRAPLGALESRKLASAMQQSGIPTPTGQMMKGDFVIAQFDTSFANLKYARETVTFEREDGAWKASGYYIKPR